MSLPLASNSMLGHHLVRAPMTERNIELLEKLEVALDLDVWGVTEKGIDIRVRPEVMPVLKGSRVEFEVVSEDVEASHGWETVSQYVCHDQGSCFDDFYTSYQNLDNYERKMQELASAHSNLISLMTIGTSYEGRSINGMILSNGGSGHEAVVYNCGTHSREWVPPPFCIYLVDTLAQGYQSGDSDAQWVLNNFDLHIIPILNPDGYVHTHNGANMWRKSRKPNRDNTYGTDLNRNFCFQWGTGGSSSIPSSDSFMGYECFDNPETQAIADYVGNVRPIAYMDIHAYGYMWMQPYGYKARSLCLNNPRGCGVDSDSDYNDQLDCAEESRVAALNAEGGNFRIGPITWVIYQASGSTADHMYGEFGVKYSYALEVRGSNFQPNPNQIMPSNRELYAGTLAQLRYAATNGTAAALK